MKGVRRKARRKFQNRPRTLKKVLVTSFFEKSPRKVIADSSFIALNRKTGNTVAAETQNGVGTPSGAGAHQVLIVSKEEMIAHRPVIMPVQRKINRAGSSRFLPAGEDTAQRVR